MHTQTTLVSNNFCNSLDQLTKQFFTDGFIDHVNIITKHSDGTVSYACNNKMWLDLYLSKKYPLIGFFENENLPKNLSFLPWESLNPHDPILIDSREMMDLVHGITFIRNKNGDTFYYNIGKKRSQSNVLGEYINKQEKIEKFIDYLSTAIESSEEYESKTRICLCGDNIEFIENGNFLNKELKGKYKYILSNLNGNSLSIEERIFYKEVVQRLSIKQLDILYLMLSGFTMKMISTHLNVGIETIKTHIKNIRLRLDYACSSQMIEDCFNHKVRHQFQQSKQFCISPHML